MPMIYRNGYRAKTYDKDTGHLILQCDVCGDNHRADTDSYVTLHGKVYNGSNPEDETIQNDDPGRSKLVICRSVTCILTAFLNEQSPECKEIADLTLKMYLYNPTTEYKADTEFSGKVTPKQYEEINKLLFGFFGRAKENQGGDGSK